MRAKKYAQCKRKSKFTSTLNNIKDWRKNTLICISSSLQIKFNQDILFCVKKYIES